MWKLLKFLKNTKDLLTAVGAVLAAAIIAVETYQELKKKIGTPGSK